MAQNYTAFISYRHLPLDIAVAENLHKQIERFRVPREYRKFGRTLGTVFRDKDELALSNHLKDDICLALDHSEFLIVVCTPDTPESRWVNLEIEYFIKKHGRDRVLTVVAAGTPETSIPRSVTHVYAEDGVTLLETVEPLCAVLTADTPEATVKNIKKEMNRLAATILGCPYDGLVQRQKQYRLKQLMALGGIALAVAAAFLVMLLTKNAQIRDQLQQTLENESQALTLLSQSQLESGDRRKAVQNAHKALYSPDGTRPYYAQAETALAEALYVYHEPEFREDYRIGFRSDVENVVFSPEGRYALVQESGRITCLDTASGEALWQFFDEAAVYFTKDPHRAVLSDGEKATVISLKTGERLLQIDTRAGLCAVSPDGSTLAACRKLSRQNCEILLFDLQTGGERSCISLEEEISLLRYLPGGELVLQAEGDPGYTVLLMDAEEELWTLGQEGGCRKVCFLRDGSLFLLFREEEADSWWYAILSDLTGEGEVQDIRCVSQQSGWTVPEFSGEILSVLEQGDYLYLIGPKTLYPVYRKDGTLVEAIGLPDYAGANYAGSSYEDRTAEAFVDRLGRLNIACADNTVYSYFTTEDFYPETAIYGNPVSYVDSQGNPLNVLWNRTVLYSRPQISQIGYLAVNNEIKTFAGESGDILAVTDPSDGGMLTFLGFLGDDTGRVWEAGEPLSEEEQEDPVRLRILGQKKEAYYTDYQDNVLYWGASGETARKVSCPYPEVDPVPAIRTIPNIWTGENGLIFVPDYTGSIGLSDAMPRAFAVYDTAADQWKRFDNSDAPERLDKFCTAASRKRAAMVWEDVLLVYDFDTNDILYRLDMGLNDIDDIQFVCEDRYLLLRDAYRNYVCFLDGETGSLVAECSGSREADMMVYGEDLLFQTNADGSLYFLSDGYNNGMILDARTWQLMALVPRMICYDPQADCVCCYSSLRDRVICYGVHTTRSLMDLAAAGMGSEDPADEGVPE